MCTPATITVTGGFSKQSKYRIVSAGYHSKKLEDNGSTICEVTWMWGITTGAGVPICAITLDSFPCKTDALLFYFFLYLFCQLVNKRLMFQTGIRHEKTGRKDTSPAPYQILTVCLKTPGVLTLIVKKNKLIEDYYCKFLNHFTSLSKS